MDIKLTRKQQLLFVALAGLSAGQASAQKAPVWGVGDPGAPSYAGYGVSLALINDYNGNGTDDILVGQPRDWGAAPQFPANAGSVFVLDGGGPGTTPLASFYGTAANGALGVALSGMPDINADGVDEILLGVPGSGTQGVTDGHVDLYLGGAASSAVRYADFQPVAPTSSGTGAGFGHEIAIIGDIDGGGTPDIAIGAPYASVNGQQEQGTVQVYSAEAAAAGGAQQPLYTITGPVGRINFGWAIVGVDDLDGDGIADIAISAPGGAGGGGFNHVGIYSGSSAAGAQGALVHSWSGLAGSRFGESLEAVSDLAGDGKRELAVGVPFGKKTVAIPVGNPPIFVFQEIDDGSVVIYTSDVVENPSLAGSLPFPRTYYGSEFIDPAGTGNFTSAFGFSLANCGDLDGDGVDDLMVGDPTASSYHPYQQGGGWPGSAGAPHMGQVRLISLGRDALIDEILNASSSTSPEFGKAVAAGKNLDGDALGSLDFVVGAPSTGGTTIGGTIHVFSGELTLGRSFGSQYVTANSSGLAASLTATGLIDTDANQISFHVSGAPAFEGGVMIYGEAALGTPVATGFGFRLVGNRGATPYYQLAAFLTDASGNADFGLDVTTPPSSAAQISGRSRWYFQYAFFDTTAGGINFSQGLEMGFY